MQCGEIMYHEVQTLLNSGDPVERMNKRPEKEAIHSGHFMVSHFEAEEQDDEDEVAVPVPEEPPRNYAPALNFQPVVSFRGIDSRKELTAQHLSIETSLSKLFQCMSLAYRQKLTSPKWNRFKGIRLRWKEKIRLNNVIWRCWHMQFILKQNTLVCQFASPLDVDTHNKPEAVVLEGKYWKRKLAAVTAEYKKWRMYYRNQALGCLKDGSDMLADVDMLDWQPDSNDSNSISMLVDQDYMEFMSDTLFSTIQSNQPFAFPDTREIAKGAGLADFIQPSLVQLQPNLDDFMDTLEPLQELFYSKLPPVPEEGVADDVLLRSLPGNDSTSPFSDLTSKTSTANSLLPQINQTVQNMGLYPQVSDPYRQPEYVSVGAVGNDSLDNRVLQGAYPRSDLQVPLQILQQQQPQQRQQQPQPQQTLQQATAPQIRSRVARPQTQGKVRPAQPAPVVRKQLPSVQHQTMPQEHQRLQQPSQYQQQPPSQQQPQTRDQHTPSPVYQLYGPSSIQPTPPPPPSPSPPQQPVVQVKMQSHSYVNQTSSQVQSPSHASQQKVAPAEAFKFTPGMTQRSFSLPTPHTATIAYASGGASSSNLSSGSGSVGNIDTATLTTIDKASSRVENELFAVPRYQKLRNRSRSGSSLLPGSSGSISGSSGTSLGSKSMRPLVSTVSNPDLSTVQTGALLAQLLTTSSPPVYSFTGATDTSASGRVMIGKSHNIPILPMPSGTAPQTTALLITTPVPMTIQTNASTNQIMLNSAPSPTSTPGASKSSDTASDSSAVPSPVGLSLSPLNMENMSPPQSLSSKSESDHKGLKLAGRGEHRRVCHINAEQKRRCNIKNGFDMLHSLIPQLSQNPNTKTSKAAMLQKGAEYIKQLRVERNQLKEEMDSLRQQIDSLNTAISNCQSMLPATGAPVSRHRVSKMREMFDEYVRTRTLENWKFWIFSMMVEPLLVSFNSSVSTSSMDELYRSTIQWVEQHCSLVELRPVVLNSLRYLCTSTEILSDPSRLPDEARQAVMKNDQSSSSGIPPT